MRTENYNGKIQDVRRLYNSLRNFIGNNQVHMPGDILCISMRNNDRYDLFLMADGVSTFKQLLRKFYEGEIAPVGQAATISKEEVEEIIRKIIDEGGILKPDSVGTVEIKNDAVKLEDLNTEVKDKMQKTYIEEDESLHMDFDERVSTAPTVPTQPIIVEEEEEP